MSMHKSLRSKRGLSRTRNVLSREERLEKLIEDEEWSEGKGSVFGLPKVKVEVVTLRKKEAKDAEEGEAETEAGAEPGAPETGPGT